MDLDDLLPKFNEPTFIPLITYSDGSANSYYLNTEQLEYDPMSPMHSNTGTYSGGAPATVTITKDQFEAIQAACQAAILCTEDHLENRPKGSGTLSMDGNRVVLAMSSPHNRKIEQLLRQALGRS